MSLNIALDGPSGAGKSTIAKAVAAKKGYIYVDTGALYRAVALYMQQCGVDYSDSQAVIGKLSEIQLKLAYSDGSQQVILNGEDVSGKIRTPEISMGASAVSAIPEVRTFLFDLQKNIAAENDIIMDGRDIGTVVLPDAQVKIFLTATPEERARRRFAELSAKGDSSTYEEVLEDIIKRDYNDSHRETAPLKKAEDAVEVDSTELDLEQVTEKIIGIIDSKTSKKKTEREMLPVRKVQRGRKIKLWRRIVYFIIRNLLKISFHIWYSLKYVGKENCPKDGSNIIVCNHRSYADPVLVSLPVRVPFSFMAKEELFQGNILFKWLITLLGAFPVQRGSGDSAAIDTSVEKLEAGRNFLIFPEGTRSKDGKLGRVKSGAALIGAVAQVPIIPCVICFEGKLKFRKKIIVAFGEPFTPEQLGADNASSKSIKMIKTKISDELNKLVSENVDKL